MAPEKHTEEELKDMLRSAYALRADVNRMIEDYQRQLAEISPEYRDRKAKLDAANGGGVY